MSIFSDITDWVENLFKTAEADATTIGPIISAGESLVVVVEVVIAAVKSGKMADILPDVKQLAVDVAAFADAINKFVEAQGVTPSATPLPAPVTTQSVLDSIKKIIADGEKIVADLEGIVVAMKNGFITSIAPDAQQVAADVETLVAAIEALVPAPADTHDQVVS